MKNRLSKYFNKPVIYYWKVLNANGEEFMTIKTHIKSKILAWQEFKRKNPVLYPQHLFRMCFYKKERR